MPNAPALVLAGAAAIAKGEHATAQDLQMAEVIFSAVGKAVVVEEKHLDAVTGLSGRRIVADSRARNEWVSI